MSELELEVGDGLEEHVEALRRYEIKGSQSSSCAAAYTQRTHLAQRQTNQFASTLLPPNSLVKISKLALATKICSEVPQFHLSCSLPAECGELGLELAELAGETRGFRLPWLTHGSLKNGVTLLKDGNGVVDGLDGRGEKEEADVECVDEA